ncbi:MAG: hypothetical protein JWM23_537 [Microbacteriaceae bacterium]|nr:hypothetical protein [Microbacteriaceae bacterium]
MSQLSWVATDALTGEIIADLPGLDVQSVKSTLGRYEATTAVLPLPTAPQNWGRATLPGATNLHLLSQPVDKRGSHVGQSIPIWGGMITQRPLTESNTLSLPLATIESYLDRRFVGNEKYTQVGQNDIINDLVTKYVRNGPNGGIPLRVEYVTPGPGKLRDREYKDQDDKTIYSVFTDLMGIRLGPEWTIGWEWQHNPERITPVLYVGDRIGAAVPAGLGPAATFEMPGAVQSFQLLEDYSNGKGATAVMATSSGEGTLRPQSPMQTTTDPTRPTFEHRWTPSTSITMTDTLTDYAKAALPALADGTRSLSLSAVADDAPPLGTDWFIGDDIGFSLGGRVPDPRTKTVRDMFIDKFTDAFYATGKTLINSLGRDTVPAFPGGYEGVGRVVGWELTLTGTRIITPTIVLP